MAGGRNPSVEGGHGDSKVASDGNTREDEGEGGKAVEGGLRGRQNHGRASCYGTRQSRTKCVGTPAGLFKKRQRQVF